MFHSDIRAKAARRRLRDAPSMRCSEDRTGALSPHLI